MKIDSQLDLMKSGLKKAFQRKLMVVKINELQSKGMDASKYLKLIDPDHKQP